MSPETENEMSDARIEAAARAGWEWECERLDDQGGVWDEMDPTLRQNLLDVCGVMLAAADAISGAEESDG
jgi:hypothetical protein